MQSEVFYSGIAIVMTLFMASVYIKIVFEVCGNKIHNLYLQIYSYLPTHFSSYPTRETKVQIGMAL